MNIDNFKNSWKELSDRLEKSEKLSLKSAETGLKNKAGNRIDLIRKKNKRLSFLFGMELLLMAAIFIGNPFDFKFNWQFFPFTLLGIFILTALLRTFLTLRALQQLNTGLDLQSYLETAIAHFDKVQQFNNWFRLSFLGAGICTILSFIPHLTQSRNFTAVAPFIVLSVAVSWAIYWLVFKSGWFEKNESDEFQADIAEWNSLRAMMN